MPKPIYPTLSVVIPAFNESKTIGYVIEQALKLNEVDELIVVDDGSIDKTNLKLNRFSIDKRFIYIKHLKNRGKGAALRTGIKRAKNEVILLLDADLKNITSQKIRKIILPVLKDEVDVSRAGFRLTRGRVTEIAVKPMMRILFPDVYFNQPISGQVCAKKEFLEKVNLEDRWGVDIGILLDAIQQGQRIIEVNIGKLDHKARTDQEKAEMAQQVLETMIEKAGLIRHKYKLITFTLDNTLIQANTLKWIFTKLDINTEITRLQEQLDNNVLSQKDFVTLSAKLFKGRTLKEIEEICLNAPLAKYSKEIISALIKRKYQVGLISTNFSPIVYPISKNLGINNIDCIHLEEVKGKLTGKITKQSQERWLVEDSISLNKSFTRIRNRAQAKPTEIIIIGNSGKILPIIHRVGFVIAFNPKDPILKELADKTIHVLPELLAIIE